MIGAGTVINPIIKIVTTVAILGAVYFFIVKPTLDTTKDITDRAFENVPNSSQITEDIQDAFDNAPGVNGSDVKIPKSSAQSQKLLECVQNASGNVTLMQKCAEKFQP